MKTIEVYKAQGPSLHSDVVESVTLVIDKEVPEQSSLVASKRVYRADAEDIMEVLAALPQGTKHQLLCLLLESSVNYYRGPSDPVEKEKQ